MTLKQICEISFTCSQETMSCQHELRRDLHFAVGVVLEGREVGLVFVGVDLFPVPVVGCRGTRVRRRGQRCSEGASKTTGPLRRFTVTRRWRRPVRSICGEFRSRRFHPEQNLNIRTALGQRKRSGATPPNFGLKLVHVFSFHHLKQHYVERRPLKLSYHGSVRRDAVLG